MDVTEVACGGPHDVLGASSLGLGSCAPFVEHDDLVSANEVEFRDTVRSMG